MKIFLRNVVLFLLFSSSVLSIAMDTAPTSDEALAVASVQAYMDALMVGDVARMRAHLAPKLLAERKALLDNPAYSQHILNAYRNASYEVVDQLWVSSDKVRVDVKIQLNSQDVVHSRFELQRIENTYRIIAER
jgi:hypothetical protein